MALLQNGDQIAIDLAEHSMNVLLSEKELASRRAGLSCPASINPTPRQAVYRSTVRQLAEGAGMAFKDQPLEILSPGPTRRVTHTRHQWFLDFNGCPHLSDN